jgi:sporulation protein YlmC with PRC-barrel domain
MATGGIKYFDDACERRIRMESTRYMNVEKELKGMTVLRIATVDRMGEGSDTILHPIEGRVVGILVSTDEGRERVLATQDFFIGKDAVMTKAGARFVDERSGQAMQAGVPAIGEIIGTNVVTDDGNLLGRVSEVHISLDIPCAVYCVAESTLQRFLGNGFYIAGDLPIAYSEDGVRLIVPADTEERYAVMTVNEAFGAQRQGAGR